MAMACKKSSGLNKQRVVIIIDGSEILIEYISVLVAFKYLQTMWTLPSGWNDKMYPWFVPMLIEPDKKCETTC